MESREEEGWGDREKGWEGGGGERWGERRVRRRERERESRE